MSENVIITEVTSKGQEIVSATKELLHIWKDFQSNRYLIEKMDNHPLCDIFLESRSGCDMCPIKIKTKQSMCRKTPMIEFFNHYLSVCYYKNQKLSVYTAEIRCDECKRLVDKSVYFLKQLVLEVTMNPHTYGVEDHEFNRLQSLYNRVDRSENWKDRFIEDI